MLSADVELTEEPYPISILVDGAATRQAMKEAPSIVLATRLRDDLSIRAKS
jgi:hypothetical protein